MDNKCNYRKKVKEENFYGGSRSKSRNSRSSSSGRWQQPVLSLEKKFCATVGGVSWQQVLDTQKYMYKDDKVLQWKDSAVQEAFWNAKKRFLAKMRGQPCDIKLPDPDIFIDEIDWDSIVDPELLLELDKRDVDVPCETEKDSGVVFGIPVVPEQYALTPMGWGDAESERDDKQLNVSERVDTNLYEQVHWAEDNGVNGWGDDYVYVTHDMVNQAEENNTRNGGSTWNSDYKKKRWGDYGGYNKKWNNSNGGRNTSRYRISRYYHCNGNNARYGSNYRGLVVAKQGAGINLQVKKGLSFKIALFADLHFGEDAWTSWGPLQDDHSTEVMSFILDQEKPDLVIYLGDIITADNIAVPNASLYWTQALLPTKQRRIPWASIFGNHDDASFVWPPEWFSDSGIPPLKCSSLALCASEGANCSFMGTTRLQLMDHDKTSSALSFSEVGPRTLWPSVSNYILKILSSEDSETPLAYLYFLDSGGGSYPEVISTAQVKWFNSTSQKINPDSRVPEIVFWHIPSRAYNTVAPSDAIKKPCVGSINKENVTPQEAEYGIMKALEARPSVQAVFVGHNHGLDWCCPYKMFWLCFARHSGYGGYGDWPRGARILEITEKPFTLKSWIMMENGDVHSHIHLSHAI